MDALPSVPGFRFNDKTKVNHHLNAQFEWKNGYAIPKVKSIGIGKYPLDVDSLVYADIPKTTTYDPILTYGKAKDPPKPIVEPNFNLLDGKLLTFNGYTKFKPSEMSTSPEKIIIRRFIITYFLVDDTIRVMEPVIKNFGFVQGCFLKRGKIPKPKRINQMYHWSDFNNGVELSFYGTTYKLCNCDLFTKNFLTKNGIEIRPDEPTPQDPYLINKIQVEQNKFSKSTTKCEAVEDQKHDKFMKYDKKVLRFYAIWYDEGPKPSRWRYYTIYYFLVDDRIEINESKEMGNTEAIANPMFLSKIKLPKDWFKNSKAGSKERQEYYEIKDLIIGNTIFVIGRRFLLYDCDPFTRRHFKDVLKIDQPDPIQIEKPKVPSKKCSWVVPPHVGFGDPDDSRQNCLSLRPKPPKKIDFVTYVLNAAKKLRYKLKMIPIIEVDNLRDFIMEYCIGNEQISITEVPMPNSGFTKGRMVAPIQLRKPGFPIEDNQYYGPKDFALGAELRIRGLTFKIVEMDIWTYNYMIEHKDMFTQKAVEEASNLFETNGFKKSEKNMIVKQNIITQKILIQSKSKQT